jgi:hypothetical protein
MQQLLLLLLLPGPIKVPTVATKGNIRCWCCCCCTPLAPAPTPASPDSPAPPSRWLASAVLGVTSVHGMNRPMNAVFMQLFMADEGMPRRQQG